MISNTLESKFLLDSYRDPRGDRDGSYVGEFVSF